MSSPPLFWQPNYRGGSAPLQFLDVETEAKGVLRVAYWVKDVAVLVPGKASFGGWWPMSGPAPDATDVAHAHEHLEARIGPQLPIQISLPPAYFHPPIFDPQRDLFRTLGFSLVEETNHTVVLAGRDWPELSKGNRKRIRQFLSVGHVAIATPLDFENCFNLLDANRRRRGAVLSLSMEEFILNLEHQPDVYTCWKAVIGDELVGAAYTVETDENATYVMFWGDSPEGRRYSVVASLFLEIWKRALASGKAFLDLGKSSVDGQIDDGLARFKGNLSARSFSQQVWSSGR